MAFDRITIDPNQLNVVRCIRHLHIPVATVVEMVAEGMTGDEILLAYPDLEHDDIPAVLHCAATQH